MRTGRGGNGQEGESGKLTDLYAKHTLKNDECLYRDAHSHLYSPTPAACGTCGRQAEALSTEGEGTEAERLRHT